MAKTVRLSDIAKECGVSTVTVSKALSGQKGVSNELRTRIIDLAAQMGYVKSTSRASQNEKKSYTIGVIVAERYLVENQSFYWSLYQEVSKDTLSRDSFCILEVVDYDAEKEQSIPRVLTERRIDGLMILGQFKKEYLEAVTAVTSGDSGTGSSQAIPTLFLDSESGEFGDDCVVSNNLLGARHMTGYLFRQGHSRIGFVGTRLTTSSIDDRYLGYVKSLMEHGQEVREDWLLEDRDRETGAVDQNRFFRLPQEMPTAFFCNCDLAASILIRKLEEYGYKVPEDVSVVGFDNYVTDQFAGVGITTYEINTREMAARAVHILFHKIENTAYTSGMFLLPGKFVERSSVRCIGPAVPTV